MKDGRVEDCQSQIDCISEKRILNPNEMNLYYNQHLVQAIDFGLGKKKTLVIFFGRKGTNVSFGWIALEA